MARVRLEGIHKSYGNVAAVRNLALDIAEGEFFSLLGPSGCGKTTTLRMIAGFESPEQGKIFFNSEDITAKAPNQRNTGMVFQSYALFPHMTVFDNVAFGLRARKTPSAEIATHVQEALQLVEMTAYAGRRVTQLSGGQQQRVALARALAIKPAILLLDEPLSNLDAKLRQTTRAELKRLQRRLGITTIYVTHDQEEALALSDRIAIMHHGELQQVGAPEEIYISPDNLFVMTFIGASNVLTGRVTARHGARLDIQGAGWQVQLESNAGQNWPNEVEVNLAFRPEHATLQQPPASVAAKTGETIFVGQCRALEYAGTHWLAQIAIGDTLCTARISDEEKHALFAESSNSLSDKAIALSVPLKHIRVFQHQAIAAENA